MERYIAFDVETPNYANSRMSAIGVAIIEGGRIVDSFGTIINPEQHFDRFNIMLTGITPEMAEAAPTFAEIWPKLRPILQSGVLVAHNASFDMRVLADCLAAYDLPVQRYLPCICTVRMGRRCYPDFPNHKLNTLTDMLGIPLEHHRADSDARACAALLIDYVSNGLDPADFTSSYDLLLKRQKKK